MKKGAKFNSLSLLVKPASSLCNLRCRYCFYEDESNNRVQKSYGIMTLETADKLIESAVSATGPGAVISVCFQGGEPTLAGLEFYRHFIEQEKRYPNRRFVHTIQTNGFCIEDNWAQFFRENSFLVGVSLDGYRDLHNKYRVTPSQEGSFDRVMQGIETLKKHGVSFNALCVVTKQCAEKPHRIYRSLKEAGFEYIQFIACLDPLGKERGQEEYSLLPQDYGRFLCAVFDNWYADWENGSYIGVRQFDDYIYLMLGLPPSSCTASGRCGTYLVAEADGSLYPCDFYVLDDWYLGNIGEVSVYDALTSEKAVAFRKEGTARPSACSSCKWLPLCHGGCKRDIVSCGEPGRDSANYYCSAFKFFFEYAAERLERIARAEYQARLRASGKQSSQ